MFSRLLGSRLWSQTSQRAVSSKYQRPKPRSYRRRWFEAAVQPVLPREVKVCTPPGLLHQENVQKGKGYDDFELALAKHVKGWMQKEQFRVLAVCQLLPVQGRTLWFTKNQWRLKGVEYKNYGGKIMRKVFEGTPMDSTDVLFTGYTACLFGRDFATLKTIMSETNKVNWNMNARRAINWPSQLYWSCIPGFATGYLLVHGIRNERLPFTNFYIHRHSEPSEYLRNLVDSELFKTKELQNKKMRIFLTDDMEPRVYGGFFFNEGPELQFPLRFSFSDVEHMRRQGAHLEVDLGYAKDRRKLEVNSDICQELFARVILSESAMRFIIQRQLQIANNGTMLFTPIIAQAAIFSIGSIFLKLLTPVFGGPFACAAAIGISSSIFIAVKPTINAYLVKKADRLVLEQDPEYMIGARDYFENVLRLNRLLRKVMGTDGEDCIQKNGESKLDAVSIRSRMKNMEGFLKTL
ncbi:unnamed protein product, partial [Mesorhabditis belari]|uniref:Uncharacterized protein n=1 Tax=Mesorhabditis belari TaxID=2138241 RepID=A0AAF3FVH5_9BILA